MRGLVVLAVLGCLLFAGCSAPAADREPDRPSVVPDARDVDGEPLHGGGAFRVSPLPEAMAPVVSPDRPMNCLDLATDTGEKTYIGGAVLVFTWTPSVGATAELTVTVSDGPEATYRASGPSPLRLEARPEDGAALALPLHLVAVPANGGMETTASQDVSFTVEVGLLESSIDALAVKQGTC